MFENKSKEEATKEILESVKEYYAKYMKKPEYKDGDRISYASRVFDEKEMVNLIVAQRAYEMNSTAIQTTDEMMQTANSLKR